MLNKNEVYRIFESKPYKESWPIDLNNSLENIGTYYSSLILSLTKHTGFSTYFSQQGGMSNYLEFICFPDHSEFYNGNAIMVCVSLCAPIVAYGQTTFQNNPNFKAYDFMEISAVGNITDNSLKDIENEIINILQNNNLEIIDIDFAKRDLPKDISAYVSKNNLNFGNKYLHGLFQHTD